MRRRWTAKRLLIQQTFIRRKRWVLFGRPWRLFFRRTRRWLRRRRLPTSGNRTPRIRRSSRWPRIVAQDQGNLAPTRTIGRWWTWRSWRRTRRNLIFLWSSFIIIWSPVIFLWPTRIQLRTRCWNWTRTRSTRTPSRSILEARSFCWSWICSIKLIRSTIKLIRSPISLLQRSIILCSKLVIRCPNPIPLNLPSKHFL